MGETSRKWLFYDALLDLVPPEAKVKSLVAGLHWFLLESDQGGLGLAHRLKQDLPSSAPDPLSLVGQPLRAAAALVKSWDNDSAAIGLAAINSAANARLSRLLAADAPGPANLTEGSAFDYFLERTRGRKVAVVGHFPNLENLAEAATLTILERRPQPGDLPDPAAEYVLEEQDAVFLTGTTILNKTLPRLLDLSQGKDVFLVGPSVPMFPELFKFGFASLSGTLVANRDDLAQAVAEDLSEEIFQRGGRMVNLSRENFV
jgi:uncharacterized protein (DUF4213/DUF364 family)